MIEPINKENLVSYLSKVSLFSQADGSVLNHLAEITQVADYAIDERVINKGDVGSTMYLILDGKCKVHDGEHFIAELKKGEFFGELSLLDSEPRSMSVTTMEESVLGSINRNDFYSVLQQFPAMTKDIIAVLNRRLRNQNDRLINEFRGREEQLKELVRIRTLELEQKNVELESALDSLRKSQEQLVQSEKLASLGQLIAGIAHEIQNPLNFVNNFSQLSNDLIKEAKETSDEEERNELLTDLEGNMSKIHHHGKRADSIVKNMLEHSRSGSGEKQKINIVQLCREYVALSYQGMRANKPEFNSDILIDAPDEEIQINVVPQEISRVILNLVNNAFYALNERLAEEKDFHPVFKLSIQSSDKLYIKIGDNAKGIPDSVKKKIFEPFFTTKPTGQGTGLGLSLSFDIIKAHGGELRFTSAENQGTEFTIALPL